jgi:GNAT superfamily N-acetyltransferase
VRLQRFDPATASGPDAAAYAALVADARRESTPEGMRQPAAYVLNRLRHNGKDKTVLVWTAHDGGALVGGAELSWHDTPDNRDRSWLNLDLPEDYDDSTAVALAAAAAEASVAVGRTLFNVDTPKGSRLSDWVGRLGGNMGSVEEHNVVRFSTVDRDDVASLAAAVPDGYELLAWDGAAPDEIVPAYCTLVDTMNDAPRDDLTIEDFVYTPERLRDWESGAAKRGDDLWTVVAREVATGELGGFNQLAIHAQWPEAVENEDTAVAVAHRGHGLGLWIKAVNMLRVMDEIPAARCIETWNAASNAHMLRVNRRLGFRCEHVWEDWELPAAAVLSETQPA